MLAFLVTDATFEGPVLQTALNRAVARSFDRISVDACESTNDSVFLLSTGRVSGVPAEAFGEQLEAACADLAEQMVRDAEGGSKLVRIRVEGASSRTAPSTSERRRIVGLVALRGLRGDPNWGRVLAALGSTDRSLDVAAIVVSIGDEVVFSRERRGIARARRQAHGRRRRARVVQRRRGPGSAEVLLDLSPEYVTLNAYGTT